MKYSLMIVLSILVLVLGSGVVNAHDITLEIYNKADVTKYFGFNGTLYPVEANSSQNITLYGVDPEIPDLNDLYLYSNDRTHWAIATLFRTNRQGEVRQYLMGISTYPSWSDPEGRSFIGKIAPGFFHD